MMSTLSTTRSCCLASGHRLHLSHLLNLFSRPRWGSADDRLYSNGQECCQCDRPRWMYLLYPPLCAQCCQPESEHPPYTHSKSSPTPRPARPAAPLARPGPARWAEPELHLVSVHSPTQYAPPRHDAGSGDQGAVRRQSRDYPRANAPGRDRRAHTSPCRGAVRYVDLPP